MLVTCGGTTAVRVYPMTRWISHPTMAVAYPLLPWLWAPEWGPRTPGIRSYTDLDRLVREETRDEACGSLLSWEGVIKGERGQAEGAGQHSETLICPAAGARSSLWRLLALSPEHPVPF